MAIQSIEPLRVAVVSTPRSGNTWFRILLAGWYGIPDSSSHEIGPEDWDRFPREVVHQIHWNRTPEFTAKLDEYGFRVATIARHPLDTLISILHFSWYDEETSCWLLGRGGDESVIRAASPRNRAFIEYAASERAAALFSVATDWWERPGVVSIRYEDLTRDPEARLNEISKTLGPPRHSSVDGVLEAGSMERQRKFSFNNHFWKGRPGLWRELLPADEAFEIAASIAPILDKLGYVVDPDPDLTPSKADRNWVRYVGEELIRTVRKNTVSFLSQTAAWEERTRAAFTERDEARAIADSVSQEVNLVRGESERLRSQLARIGWEAHELRASRDHHLAELLRAQDELTETHRRLGAAHAELQETHARLGRALAEVERGERLQARLDQLGRELEETRRELDRFRGLGGFSLRVARSIQNLRDRFPRLDRGFKSLSATVR